MNILLVDTCEDLVKDMKCYFEVNGHKCTSTDNPLNALTLLQLNDYDVLISEFFADDENYELAFKEMRKRKIPTKIIILTAQDYKISDLKTLYELQISSIFEKPIPPEVLLDTLTKFENKNKFLKH